MVILTIRIINNNAASYNKIKIKLTFIRLTILGTIQNKEIKISFRTSLLPY